MNSSEPVSEPVSESVSESVLATVAEPTIALDARTLLARVNAKVIALRRLIRHDHGDVAYWSAHETTAPWAQSERAVLRAVADLLHVERAHRRNRLHGTRFATLDDQRQWLESMMHRCCGHAARAAGLPRDATLARLRAGELPRDQGSP